MPRTLRHAAVLALLAVGSAGCAATRTGATSGGLLVPETTVGTADTSSSPTTSQAAGVSAPTTSDLDEQLDEIDVLLEDLDETLAENDETD